MASYNPQATYNPQGSSPTLQGSAPQLQASPASGLQVQPAYQPNLNTSGTGGIPLSAPGGGGGAAAAAAADPYAAYGGEGAYNNLVSGFTTQDQNIHSTSADAAQNAALGRHSSILDWLDSMRTGQRGIDEQGVQNELAKKQGFSSIVDMVGRGLRSGGTLLANKNALSSSAAEAIARAYGDVGHRELNKVGNQYELQNREIGLNQETLNQSKGTGLRKFGESGQMAVGQIVTDARNKLASLDAAMVGANMPTRIQIEQEKQQIQGQVQQIIGQFDPELQQGAAAINPTSTDARRATAFGLANAGQSATNPFDFNTQTPVQLQNTGPFGGELPIFTVPGAKKQFA